MEGREGGATRKYLVVDKDACHRMLSSLSELPVESRSMLPLSVDVMSLKDNRFLVPSLFASMKEVTEVAFGQAPAKHISWADEESLKEREDHLTERGMHEVVNKKRKSKSVGESNAMQIWMQQLEENARRELLEIQTKPGLTARENVPLTDMVGEYISLADVKAPHPPACKYQRYDAELALSRRSRRCNRMAALLASSEANKNERSLTRPLPSAPTSVSRKKSEPIEASLMNEAVATFMVGDDDWDVHDMIEPQQSLELLAFLHSFQSVAATGTSTSVTFNDEAMVAMSILLDELIMDMMRRWETTGSPLGTLQIGPLRRTVMALLNGSGRELVDLGQPEAVRVVKNRAEALFGGQNADKHAQVIQSTVQKHLEQHLVWPQQQVGTEPKLQLDAKRKREREKRKCRRDVEAIPQNILQRMENRIKTAQYAPVS